MPQEVRCLSADELPEFVEGLEWLFEHPGGRPSNWDRVEAARRAAEVVASPEAALFGAYGPTGGLVGVASVYLDILSVRFGRRASIEDLAVHPEWRSRGVGSSLLTAARTWAVERGADYVFLESGVGRTHAHRFYLREGAAQIASSFRWTTQPDR